MIKGWSWKKWTPYLVITILIVSAVGVLFLGSLTFHVFSQRTPAVHHKTSPNVTFDGKRKLSLVKSIPAHKQVVSAVSHTTVEVNAVGDIAACGPAYRRTEADGRTETLLSQLNGPILGLGDYVYPDGSPSLFNDCFNSVWGALTPRMRPAPGNHEYYYPNAVGYYQYFGQAAGDPSKGYYSFNLGNWHLIALNSVCPPQIGGCGPDSPQIRWLQADLKANTQKCILAYWHHPLFDSGGEGDTLRVQAFWDVLYQYHATLVLNGHDHSYERFAPMNPAGRLDQKNGITEFIVGTGGKEHTKLKERQPNSLVFNNTSFGVLRLWLEPNGYSWKFEPIKGETFTDSGSGACR